MLKKFLIIFFVLSQCSFAIIAPSKDDYINFMKSLNLTSSQKKKINQIEHKTEEKNSILRKEASALRLQYSNCNTNCSEILQQVKIVDKEMYQNLKQKDNEIMKILNFFQRQRYKEYRSRVY